MGAAKKRYRQLVKALHPDKRDVQSEALAGGKALCDRAFRLVQESWEKAEEEHLRPPQMAPRVVAGTACSQAAGSVSSPPPPPPASPCRQAAGNVSASSPASPCSQAA